MTFGKEFVPMDQVTRLMRFWWVLVICAVVGGAAGLSISRSKPPVYEAQAVFLASIDYNKIDFIHPLTPAPTPYQFSQYDEDLSLAFIQGSLVQVAPQVAAFAQQLGIQTDATALLASATIEREHAFWKVRYPNPDPVLAQKVVNYWAQQGFDDLKGKRAAGLLPPYILFDLIQLADVPKTPAYYQTNSFVMAGGVMGMVAGIFIIGLSSIKIAKGH